MISLHHQSDDDNFDDDLVINDDYYNNDTGYNQSESDSEGMLALAEVSAFDILLKASPYTKAGKL